MLQSRQDFRARARSAVGLALSVLMAALCGCSSQQSLRQPDDPILAALLEPGIVRGFPGIAFLTETADGRIRAAAAGTSDISRQAPMRADDAFHLASITKTITAVAALRLVDQGRLSLDATLPTVLPPEITRHVAHAEEITVRQLIDHSSGIYGTNNDPAYLDTVIGPNADPRFVWTVEDLAALADPSRFPPPAEPGAGHHYSDTNYTLLSIIIARASGRPFKDFVREQIFNPLCMGSTYYYSDRLPDGSGAVPTVRGYLIATPEIRAAVNINPMFQPGARRIAEWIAAAGHNPRSRASRWCWRHCVHASRHGQICARLF